MGNLISVVGNTGVGKTTLTRLLCQKTGLLAGFEEHIDRPFQALFKEDPSYAFNNQVDYMVFRVEQEQAIRSGEKSGILDGGLEMDLFVFSNLFHRKGWLSDLEMESLRSMYHAIRKLLPPPDLIIFLFAPLDVIIERYERRGREIEIAQKSDIDLINTLLLDWMHNYPEDRIFQIDVSGDDPNYTDEIPLVLERLSSLTGKSI